MRLYLKTITPLHIGNGEELNALDYIINNNNYYKNLNLFYFIYFKIINEFE